ncbi:MAG: DedA family protein [Burkholderiales bacterium]|nr:DedA family protein [Burkholderiales bacterium]
MSFPLVVAIALVGGFLGDQFFFFLGKRYGDRVLDRFPRIAAKAPRVKELLYRWDAPIIICIRFMYGLRIAGPIIIGTAGISPWRLAIFNFIGAAIWAPLVAGFGYLSGFALEKILEDFDHGGIIVLVIVALAVLIAGWIFYRRRRQRGPPG